MHIEAAVGPLLLGGAFLMGSAACLLVWLMLRDLNAKNANERQAYIGWTYSKLHKVLNDFEREFPGSKKVPMFQASMITGTASGD
jgi:hypothetical protein